MLGNEGALQICNDYAIRNSYDEIYNVNLDTCSYVLVHCINNKLLSPEPHGNFGKMIEYTYDQLIYSEDRKRHQDFNIETILKELNDSNDGINYEFRRKGTDGNYYWVELSINKIEADDNYNLAVCLVRNVDNKKKQEEELKKKQVRYDMALKSDFNFICDVDVKSGIYSIVMTDIKDLPLPEVGEFNKHTEIMAEEMIHPDDKEWFLKTMSLDNLLEYFEREEELEYEFRIIDSYGVLSWHRFIGRYYEETQGENPSIILICSDITNKKSVEELALKYKLLEQQYMYQDNLYANSTRFNTLILQMDTIIFEWSLEKGILYLSANWDEKFGKGKAAGIDLEEEMMDEDRVYFEDLERFREFSKDMINGIDSREVLVRLRELNGHYYWYRLMVTQILDSEGKADKLIGTITKVDKVIRDVYKFYEVNRK